MMRVSKMAQQKTPEPQSLGFFYSVLGGWLKPKAGYQLFISIQPGDTPPSFYLSRGGSLLIIA